MTTNYSHLGEFSDWVDEAKRQQSLFSSMVPGVETRQFIRELMGFSAGLEQPQDLRLERSWVKDGLEGQALSWSVGFGPRTSAWALKPAGAKGRLPVVLGLHDHDGFKFVGKEKITDGPDEAPVFVQGCWDRNYGGRAWANELARKGFLVLVHDTFLWGSRRFDLATMEKAVGRLPDADIARSAAAQGIPKEVARYNATTGVHEHLVSKYCNLLGTTLAGVVSRDDRIALNYLQSRPDADPERAACMGLSGGGNRSALLMASAEKLKAAVIVGLMSTFEGLLDHNVVSHTWMFYPFLLSRAGDWPDLAASRAPAALLVQYDNEDGLFTQAGMHAAHERLTSVYTQAGSQKGYTGQFYPGPHKFDLEMQENAFTWLKENL
jgi:dienelactone hydrolase